MKKLIFLLIIHILFLTGCSDYRELSDLSIVSSIGIEKKDDNYVVYTQVLNSNQQSSDSSSQNSTPQIVVYEASGKTLHEVLRNTVLESPKKLYVGHVETLVVSQEIANEDISMIFDFFLRDPETNVDFIIFFTKDNMNDIMNTLTPLKAIPGENISLSMELSSKIQGNVDSVTFDKFVSNILDIGIDPVMPILTILEIESKDEQINPSKRLVISKEMGIFDDNKLLTTINEDASFGYNLINNNFDSSVISFKCDKNSYGSIEIIDSKTDLSFNTKNNTLEISSNIDASLSELDCNIDVSNKKNMDKLEKTKEENHLYYMMVLHMLMEIFI